MMPGRRAGSGVGKYNAESQNIKATLLVTNVLAITGPYDSVTLDRKVRTLVEPSLLSYLTEGIISIDPQSTVHTVQGNI